MKAFVARYPFLVFAILTLGYQFAIVLGVKYVIGDGELVSGSASHHIFRLRIIGPLFFSVLLTFYLEGVAGVKKLFSSFFHWKIPAWWYAMGLIWKFVFGYTAVLLVGGLFSFWPAWAYVPDFWFGWAGTIPFIIIIAFVEETGWISFSLVRMQARYSAFTSALIVGLCWGLWYLPMLIVGHGVPLGYPVPVFLGSMFALTIFLAWVYNSTRSGLLLLIAQFVSNTTFFVVPVLPEVVSSEAMKIAGTYELRPITAFAGVFLFVSTILLIKYGRENLSTTGERAKWLTEIK